jgi:hypothetical protein
METSTSQQKASWGWCFLESDVYGALRSEFSGTETSRAVQTIQHIRLFKGSAIDTTAPQNQDSIITTESTAG